MQADIFILSVIEIAIIYRINFEQMMDCGYGLFAINLNITAQVFEVALLSFFYVICKRYDYVFDNI